MRDAVSSRRVPGSYLRTRAVTALGERPLSGFSIHARNSVVSSVPSRFRSHRRSWSAVTSAKLRPVRMSHMSNVNQHSYTGQGQQRRGQHHLFGNPQYKFSSHTYVSYYFSLPGCLNLLGRVCFYNTWACTLYQGCSCVFIDMSIQASTYGQH